MNSEEERVSQRGGVAKNPIFGNRPVTLYQGEAFPFNDGQFDYIICSHVIEHVDDPAFFVSELMRVGSGRGYLEYPLITYEYLYDFDLHMHFAKFDFENRILRYMPKKSTTLSEFSPVCRILRMTLEYGWNDICSAQKNLFFEGFEFDTPFTVVKESMIDKLLPQPLVIRKKSILRRAISYAENKIGF